MILFLHNKLGEEIMVNWDNVAWVEPQGDQAAIFFTSVIGKAQPNDGGVVGENVLVKVKESYTVVKDRIVAAGRLQK